MKSYIKSKLSNNFLHKIWHWFKSKFDFIKNAFHSGEKSGKKFNKNDIGQRTKRDGTNNGWIENCVNGMDWYRRIDHNCCKEAVTGMIVWGIIFAGMLTGIVFIGLATAGQGFAFIILLIIQSKTYAIIRKIIVRQLNLISFYSNLIHSNSF